jgi:hypothetical protein
MSDAPINIHAEPKPASDLARAAALGGVKGTLATARFNLKLLMIKGPVTPDTVRILKVALDCVERAIRIADDPDAYLAEVQALTKAQEQNQ